MKTSFPGRTTGEARFRQVAASVLATLHLLNAATVYVVLNGGRPAPSDQDGLGAADLACLLSICLSIAAIQFCLRPSVRRVLAPWWAAPAVVLGAIASLRLAALF
ncbi:hypothetical protein ABZW32_10155 [Streptomyces sp. NPDC004667]|uniref:hypothetical protein n=1 Tax=Streptomyces sp. NPDC004667 TaxID=3154285 RepID=UPI0033B31531